MGRAKIGIAVIGIGGNMGGHKGEILKTLDGLNLFGVETNIERRQKAIEKLGIEVYDDIDTVLKRKDIQAVTIDVPNAYHADLTVRALNAGKYVLCEKPMATTLKDCQKMLEAVERNRGFLQIGFELRYSILYKRMKEIIEAGEIGKVANISCFYTPGPYGYTHGTGWKKDPKLSGGIFPEKLCHYIDLKRWYLGQEITEIVCFAGPNVVPDDYNIDNCHMMCRFTSGAVGELTFMFGRAAVPEPEDNESLYPEAGHKVDHTIIGEKGAVFCDLWGKWIMVTENFRDGRYYPRIKRRESYQGIHTELFQHNVIDEVKDFVWRIRSDKAPYTSPYDSYKTMAACFAAEESAKNGKIIKCKSRYGK